MKVGSIWRYKNRRFPDVRYRVVSLGEWRSGYLPVPNVLLERDDLVRKCQSRRPEQWLTEKLELDLARTPTGAA